MNQLLNLPFSISYYSTVLQYKQSRIHRPKLRNKNCSFIFCCIRIRNNNSGSRQIPDPCGSGFTTLVYSTLLDDKFNKLGNFFNANISLW